MLRHVQIRLSSALLYISMSSAAAATLSFSSQPSGANIFVVSTSGSTATLNEFVTSGPASPTQSLQIPGCNLATSSNQCYGSSSANGLFAFFPCGTTASASRLIVRISSSNVVDTTTNYSGTSNALPRGVGSLDGNTIYAADNSGIYTGSFGSKLQGPLATYNYFGTVVGTFASKACTNVLPA